MPDRSGWERRAAFELAGRRAVVVGVETHAGRVIAETLAEAGAEVAGVNAGGRGDGPVKGSWSHHADWDIASASGVDAGMSRLCGSFGTPNVLVTATDAWYAAPIQETEPDQYARVIAINLNAVYFSCRAFLRNLPRETENARIICMTNVFGQRGIDDLSAYGAAHGGVHNLVRMLAQETGDRRGMTVNAIATGWMTNTPGRGPDELGANRLMRFVPQRRFGEPAEVGPLAVLLVGEASGFISGQILHIDGGITTHL
ncbi:MAG: SDR family NAD(P)-dependent oxidoreductase [Dehalococcoidia bacterium]